jgi:hypothetical protein
VLRNTINESDTLHNEQHWLHNGGREGGERELPTKEVLLQRAVQLLKGQRQEDLNRGPSASNKRYRFDEGEEY